MITEINLNNVACYKSQVTLPVNNENTLIYGLNGSGKSIFSNFLYDPSQEKYAS